jgi:serine/threonine protein kinase
MTDLAPGMHATPNIVLEKKLAEGGMGSVWVADHLSLKTRVAVKFVIAGLGKDKDAMARFEREATAVARIKSPHIVQVLDYGKSEATGQPFIVMELLEGEDLGTKIDRDGALPLPYVATIMSQACKAIGKAHQAGIVHRDIKPDNLFLVDPDGDVFVKVLDFGIAKWSEPSVSSMTSTGSMMGTPHFMAPEQMTSAKDVAPVSDVWALGVVTYNALTGHVPFDGETMAALAIAVHTGTYKRATAHNPTLPPAIDAWFEKALAKDPAKRFKSTKELAETLKAVAEGRDWTVEPIDGPGSTITGKTGMSAPRPRSDGKDDPNAESASKAITIVATTTSAGRPPAKSRSGLFLGLGLIALAIGGTATYFVTAKGPKTNASHSETGAASEAAVPAKPVPAPTTHAVASAPIVEPVASAVPSSASSTVTASTATSAAPSATPSAKPVPVGVGQGKLPVVPTAKPTAVPTAAPVPQPTGVPVTF